jgi:hypothetical protein
VALGGHVLRLDGDTIAGHPEVAGYEHRQIVVGVRPHHLREADASTPADARLRVPVAATEQIGGDSYVRFVMHAPLLLSEDGRDVGDPGSEPWPVVRVNLWTAKVERAPAVGDVIELAVAQGRIQLFDPRTGASLGR